MVRSFRVRELEVAQSTNSEFVRRREASEEIEECYRDLQREKAQSSRQMDQVAV